MRSKDEGDDKQEHDQSCKPTRKTCGLLYVDYVDFLLLKKNDIFYQEGLPEEQDFNRRAYKQKSETTLIIIPDVTKS